MTLADDDAAPRAGRDWVVVGRVGRPHGLQGAFVVEDASDDPQRFAVGATVRVDDRPLRVVESKHAGGRPVIRLERPVERGASLTVGQDELPPAAPDSFYVFQLVGLAVEESGSGRPLGRVANVLPGVANDALELDSGLALPLVEDCIRAIDLDGGRILVASGFTAPG